jgi:hypothetical protein
MRIPSVIVLQPTSTLLRLLPTLIDDICEFFMSPYSIAQRFEHSVNLLSFLQQRMMAGLCIHVVYPIVDLVQLSLKLLNFARTKIILKYCSHLLLRAVYLRLEFVLQFVNLFC